MAQPDYSLAPLRGAGLDCIGNLVQDGLIRPVRFDGELFGSLVDLMTVFGEDNRETKTRKKPFNPRGYWSQHKRVLLGKDEELYHSVIQLPLLASDGKRYKTDVAPLWGCVFIVLLMDTPLATEFKKRIAKFTAAEIKYRLMNVSQGSEWAADSIHGEMADLEPPALEPAYLDIGYRR